MECVLLQKEVIYTISNVRNHSKSLYEHSLSVAALSVLIAVRAGYTQTEAKEIAMNVYAYGRTKKTYAKQYRGIYALEMFGNHGADEYGK